MPVDVAYLRVLLNAVKAHNEITTKNLLGLTSEKEKKGDLVSRMELQKTSIREAFNKNKHCEVLVSCSNWVDWIDLIELHALESCQKLS